MSDPDRVDLSALGTAHDPARWRAVVDATLLRVDAVLARRSEDPLSLIASWTRPLLAAAAVLLALLLPLQFTLEARESRAERVDRLVTLSTGWVDGEPPSGTEFLRVLAGEGQR